MKKNKIIILGILVIISFLIIGCKKDNITGNTIVDTSDAVTISLASLSNTVDFYEYDDNGVKISYFVVLGSDGKARTAFDACDVCGGYKGYRQQGNDIVCNNCGKVFRIDGLGSKNKGYGCWPSFLPHEIEGDNLIIQISDIKQ